MDQRLTLPAPVVRVLLDNRELMDQFLDAANRGEPECVAWLDAQGMSWHFGDPRPGEGVVPANGWFTAQDAS